MPAPHRTAPHTADGPLYTQRAVGRCPHHRRRRRHLLLHGRGLQLDWYVARLDHRPTAPSSRARLTLGATLGAQSCPTPRPTASASCSRTMCPSPTSSQRNSLDSECSPSLTHLPSTARPHSSLEPRASRRSTCLFSARARTSPRKASTRSRSAASFSLLPTTQSFLRLARTPSKKSHPRTQCTEPQPRRPCRLDLDARRSRPQ